MSSYWHAQSTRVERKTSVKTRRSDEAAPDPVLIGDKLLGGGEPIDAVMA